MGEPQTNLRLRLECSPVQEGTGVWEGLLSQGLPLQGWGHRGWLVLVP